MPRIRPPRSDAGLAHLLRTAVTTATSDAESAPTYLPAALVTEITTFLEDRMEDENTIPGFETHIARRTASEGAVTRETGEAKAAEDNLDTHIRDYIVVLARRTFRLKHSVAVLDYHDLDHDGNIPVITSREDRRIVARQLVDGDAAATAAGFPAMVNPSAAELAAVLETATRETEEILPADRAFQEILQQIREARPRATALVEDVLAELRHSTRRIEPGTARDIMRSYGVTFQTLPGETPEPGDVPADPAPPAAPGEEA